MGRLVWFGVTSLSRTQACTAVVGGGFLIGSLGFLLGRRSRR